MTVDFDDYYELLNIKFWEYFENRDRINISYGGAGSGKCLKKGTKVIMFSGELKRVEDVKAGDLLMGIDSKPRRVLERHDGYGNLYIVKQNKGIDYIVNENHILTLKKSCHLAKAKGELLKSGSYRRPRGKYPDIPEILNIDIKEFINQSKGKKRYFRGYRAKIEFQEKPVKLDPYFLGVWLGDGHSHTPAITTMDTEIINYLYAFRDKFDYKMTVAGKANNKANTYLFVKKTNNSHVKSPLMNIFLSYDLIKNKHIPDDYLYNSRDVRLQLLAGLIDTDGTMGSGYYSIIQKNERLLRQIQFLCSSLGFRCFIKKRRCSCMVRGEKFTGDYYNLGISGDVHLIPVKIDRKKIKNIHKNKDPYVTGIKVEYWGEGEFVGFEIDGDHLFMLEDCTVVHNSFSEFQRNIYRIIAEPGHNYLICRKVASTNKTSTYALTKQIMNILGVSKLFIENKSEMSFTVKETGCMMVFKGLDDIEKIKSFTFPKGILTDIVIEEASEISQDDFNQLNIRLRGERIGEQANITFQITMLLNPISDIHWIKREFFDLRSYQKEKTLRDGRTVPGTKTYLLHSTYLDNIFIDEDYKAILEGYKDIDQYFYDVYCLGKWGSIGNVIFNNWTAMECPYEQEDMENVSIGMDFGFNHPQVIEKMGFKDGALYSFNEVCLREKTNMEFIKYNEELDVFRKGEKCTADSAEPSKIKEWVQQGYGVIGAIKGPGSVHRGIDFLKTFKWYIDPIKCPRLLQEVQVYHWKKSNRIENKGETLDEPVEIMDDCLTGDTIINTAEGDFKIKDLIGKEGFLKCIDTGTGKIVTSKYHSVKQVCAKKIIKVETSDNRVIRCSEDHLILTRRGWVMAKFLDKSDFIVDIQDSIKYNAIYESKKN